MSIELLTLQILEKMPKVGCYCKRFWSDFFITMLVCRGRYNFINFSRYSNFSETTIRTWFSKPFDFLEFNMHLNTVLDSEEKIIVFDPSFLSKSGNCTDGIGKFWSGCSSSVKRGLEVGGFASVGLESKTALHLIAVQTIGLKEEETLIDFYIRTLKKHAPSFLEISQVLVADSYFSKEKYVSAVCDLGFDFVGKLPSNRILRYRYLGGKTGKKGRPKQFDGIVDKRNPSPKHFSVFLDNPQDDTIGYEGIVQVKAFKKEVKCVIIHTKNKKGKIKIHTFFSTDTTLTAQQIITYYKLRFQIEFLFRDAKQFVGLNQCQARSEQKIHNHINASLTTVSLAKAVELLKPKNKMKKAFSMQSIKMRYFNENYIIRILNHFKKKPKIDINSEQYQELKSYGCIAA